MRSFFTRIVPHSGHVTYDDFGAAAPSMIPRVGSHGHVFRLKCRCTRMETTDVENFRASAATNVRPFKLLNYKRRWNALAVLQPAVGSNEKRKISEDSPRIGRDIPR